ncbi:MAG: agmatinase family protein [Elusimicrobia bacterium]|nr:agmatinase family protein [Elusimicrobiota bacterium]MDE2424387.1 agmatinase family protein [Elusimicrobiota bacterium]
MLDLDSTSGSGIFGLPFKESEAAVVYLPVPWEATVSYGSGASKGPSSILKASAQVDLYDVDVLRPYEAGLHMLPIPREVRSWNKTARAAALKVIRAGGNVGGSRRLRQALDTVNAMSARLNAFVRRRSAELMAAGKIVGLVGGDHSAPYGAIQAAIESNAGLGLLHIDAHHDLRRAYEGFVHSHASILYNVLSDFPGASKLVQVGIRDFSEREAEFAAMQGSRVAVFYDRDLVRAKFSGRNWAKLCDEIVAELPQSVWITFDIDGLDPRFCPNTGTPVPGGLDFNEANFLLGVLARSGRKIVGFDLNEVSPGRGSDWDANVGARLLYKLTAWTLASQGRAKLR